MSDYKKTKLWATPTASSNIAASMEASQKEAKRLHPRGQYNLATQVATNQEATKSTSYAEASPASLFPLPESSERKKMTAISGRRCFDLYGSASPLGSLARTLLDSLTWASTKCALIWKAKATPSSRLLFQLAPSALPTGGTGSGSSRAKMGTPTPTASDLEGEGYSVHISRKSTNVGASNGELNLETGKSVSLDRFVKMWPTPAASDHRDRGGPSDQAIKRRKEIGKSVELSMTVDGHLNPEWVGALMGFPPNWTRLDEDG